VGRSDQRHVAKAQAPVAQAAGTESIGRAILQSPDSALRSDSLRDDG
jgi:hypothetical protein